MQATRKIGRLIWTPNGCEAGDWASVMNDITYYLVPPTWQLSKFGQLEGLGYTIPLMPARIIRRSCWQQ
jgi:hypothetical protein